MKENDEYLGLLIFQFSTHTFFCTFVSKLFISGMILRFPNRLHKTPIAEKFYKRTWTADLDSSDSGQFSREKKTRYCGKIYVTPN